MTLFEELQTAKTEEDVKDIYIKHLKLKTYQKGLIDIQTKEIWFEAKIGNKNSTYKMFTQLLHYINQALNNPNDIHYGEQLPPFLCVIDSVKAAIMETKTALPLLQDKSIKIKWGKSASDVSQDALEKVSQYIGTHFVSFNIQHNENEFIAAVKSAIEKGEIIRTQITPNNLKQVFDKWVEMIGREIANVSEEKYALLFFADVMSDGTVSTHENLPAELIHRNNKPAFLLEGKLYDLGNFDGYKRFWQIYDRPPKAEYRNYLLERRDSLIPTDERSFKGAYYTPLKVVEKAYDLLDKTLGANWQRDYIVWDMCCGVGNLETKHSNHRNIFMSTLDAADVDVMKAAKTCVSASRFQYDYLNDDIADDGTIDYSLTNKVPPELRKILEGGSLPLAPAGKPSCATPSAGAPRNTPSASSKKKILVLINPPYGEATSAENARLGVDTDKEKTGIKRTKMAAVGMSEYGKASNELFTQFIARIAKEIPNATIAMFSKLKYINSQAMADFRNIWSAEFLDGFVVHSKAFDGLKGDFPIGFLIWKTNNTPYIHTPPHSEFPQEITCEVLDKDANPIGEKKFYNLDTKNYLTNWIERPKPNDKEVIPLKNAITPATASKDLRGTRWSDNAIAYFWCNSNDTQQASARTALFSSGFNGGHGIFVNNENLEKCAVVFTVRRIIPHTWLNDIDQFLQPNCELPQEFIDDCLVWMLFNGSNLTAGANGLEWNNKTWSIVNHFIPFTEEELGAPDRFESHFMIDYINEKSKNKASDGQIVNSQLSIFNYFSTESAAVLEEGKKLWREYFSKTDNHKIREELKLNRADAGWYQIRGALKKRGEDGESVPTNFAPFEAAYKALSEKLRPLVYEHGFLR